MEPDARSRKPVRVTIYNQSYTLLASEEPGAVESLARSVDELMHAVAQKAGTVDSTRAAVLACLHLADQLRSLERDLHSLRNRIDDKTRSFSMLLDQIVDSDPPK